MSETLKIYKPQETARLSEADLSYLHECYESISGTDQRIPLGTFLMKSVDRAMTQTKPAPSKIEENPEYIQAIANYEAEKLAREKAESELSEALEQLSERTRQLNEAGIIGKDQILLNFSDKLDWLTFVQDIMIIAKHQQYADSYEALITRIISEFKDAGYFKLTEADKEIIKKARNNG
jgi:hypothetical protein